MIKITEKCGGNVDIVADAEADGRIGIVNHALEVVYESYAYVNPKNVVDWCTSCKSLLLFQMRMRSQPLQDRNQGFFRYPDISDSGRTRYTGMR